MPQAVYVSRLRELLRQRGLTVSDLHRTLREQGYDVSRSALDRVASDAPIAGARFGVVIPVLDALGVGMGDVFEPISLEEAQERRRVRQAAAGFLRPPRGRRSLSRRAEASYDAAIAQAMGALRSKRPDLFDGRGRPRKRAIARMVAEASGGKTRLTGEEYDAILARAAAVIARQGA